MRSSVPCKFCPTRIVWSKHHKTGKPAPIEAEHSEQGNILFSEGRDTYVVLSGEDLVSARDADQSLHLNHFATCAGADRARRERSK